LIIGVAYKKDVDDMRESSSLKLIELLLKRGAMVEYHDPYISRMPSIPRHKLDMTSVPITPENLNSNDVVIIATDHSCLDYDHIAAHSRLMVDTRNAIDGSNYQHKLVKA
jgi:UDP-N-acetyl-D-glucosamine dehydrogenase